MAEGYRLIDEDEDQVTGLLDPDDIHGAVNLAKEYPRPVAVEWHEGENGEGTSWYVWTPESGFAGDRTESGWPTFEETLAWPPSEDEE